MPMASRWLLREVGSRGGMVTPRTHDRPLGPLGPPVRRQRPLRRGWRFGLLVERRYLAQAQPTGLMEALRAHGHEVTLVDPQGGPVDVGDDRWLHGLDMVVARGRSWELLCMMAVAETRGVATVNLRAAIAAVHNKAEMGARLAAGRVPTPRTLLAPGARLTAASRIERFPLVLKPVFGDNGRDVRVIRDRAELERLGWSEPLVLAQEFIAGDGHELKLYVIGHDVWAVRRPAMLLADGRADGPPAAPPAGEAVPLRPGERDLALCCKRLFGLELFGLDCIRTPSGTVVIEVNDFPNYGSVPSASERLADFVMKRARATRRRT